MHAGTLIVIGLCVSAIIAGIVVLTGETLHKFPTVVEWAGWLMLAYAISAVIVGITAFAESMDYRTCEDVAENFDRDFRHDWNAGCFIQTENGDYIPRDNYRVVTNDSES